MKAHRKYILQYLCILVLAAIGTMDGSVPNDRNFLTALNYYTDLLTLNQQREDRVPDHIDAMFQERYGYHFNRD